MNLKSKQIKIGENEFRINCFDAIVCQKRLFKLTKYISLALPAVKELINDKDKEQNTIDQFLNLDYSKLGSVLFEILDKIGEEEYTKLLMELVSECYLIGKGNGVDIKLDKDLFNKLFSGADYISLFKLIFEVIKLNFLTPSLLEKVNQFAVKMKTKELENSKTE